MGVVAENRRNFDSENKGRFSKSGAWLRKCRTGYTFDALPKIVGLGNRPGNLAGFTEQASPVRQPARIPKKPKPNKLMRGQFPVMLMGPANTLLHLTCEA